MLGSRRGFLSWVSPPLSSAPPTVTMFSRKNTTWHIGDDRQTDKKENNKNRIERKEQKKDADVDSKRDRRVGG